MKIAINGEILEVSGGGGALPEGTVAIKPLTQAEYDALTDAEKQADVVYAITDDAGSSGSSGEVYSTEEVRIGTWIDGKPLYRKVFSFPEGLNFPATTSSSVQIATPDVLNDLNADRFCRLEAVLYNDGLVYPLPWSTFSTTGSSVFGVTSFYISYTDRSGVIMSRITTSSQTATFIYAYVAVEYTKTTDTGGAV